MQVILLAAGRGTRLFGEGGDAPPKSLLRFDGQTLLQRHLDALAALGLEELTVITGYRARELERELARAGAGLRIRTAFNPRFHLDSGVSLWMARDALRRGEDVLFMDADVLYDPALLARLLDAPSESGLLFDASFEPGEDPVMVCLEGERIVEFGKQVPGDFERVGEWPGFARLSAQHARELADALERALPGGAGSTPYEPVLREVILARDGFAALDVTGLPWIEIDFPEDLERAHAEIMPRLRACRSA